MEEAPCPSVLAMALHQGIGPAFSVKGVVVKVVDAPPSFERIFFELTRDEDTLMVKAVKRPCADPTSIHLNHALRMSTTPDERHFLCARSNRPADIRAAEADVACLNNLASCISKSPPPDMDVIRQLMRVLNEPSGAASSGAAPTAARPPEESRKRARQPSNPAPAPAPSAAPAQVNDGGEVSDTRRMFDMSDEAFVDHIAERFKRLSSSGVKTLINKRLTFQVKEEKVVVDGWVKAVFSSLRKLDHTRVENGHSLTLADIFELDPKAHGRAHPELFGGEWPQGVSIETALQTAFECSASTRASRPEPPSLGFLWLKMLKTLGVL